MYIFVYTKFILLSKFMQTIIQKWGNSLAIRIPKSFSKETGIIDGSSIEMSLDNGKIVIKPLISKSKQLDILLKKINLKNIHTEMDFGVAQGGEIW
jgi:antitoxin MazE